MQADAQNAKVQIANLEAALQKGSEVTVSMTEKVAQALAAANAQVEALKVTDDSCSRAIMTCSYMLTGQQAAIAGVPVMDQIAKQFMYVMGVLGYALLQACII